MTPYINEAIREVVFCSRKRRSFKALYLSGVGQIVAMHGSKRRGWLITRVGF